MRVERRERVIRAWSAANRACAGGAGERVEAGGQVVCDFEAAGLGGVAEGEGQRGGCGCLRGVDPGVRGEPCGGTSTSSGMCATNAERGWSVRRSRDRG